MKANLRFERIVIVSSAEKAARDLSFGPTKTILLGDNQTGKSTVAKSLFWAFGCEPYFHPSWTDAQASAWVQFTVNGQQWSVLRYRTPGLKDTFGLFNDCGRLILQTRKVTGPWSEAIARILGFHLKFVSRGGDVAQPPPAYMFLPFYIDQDQSWGKAWNAFNNLGQYADWQTSLVAYFAGEFPGRYYDLLTERAALRQKRARANAEFAEFLRVQEQLRETFPELRAPNLPPQEFQTELRSWLARKSELAAVLDALRSELTQVEAEVASLEGQERLMEAARGELIGDLSQAARLPAVVSCPTCGQEHQNGIVEKFRVARDAEQCDEVLLALRLDLERARAERSSIRRRISDTVRALEGFAEPARVETRVGPVDAEELIEQAGRLKLEQVLSSREENLVQSRAALDASLATIASGLKEATDPQRKADVLRHYRAAMTTYLSALDVQLKDAEKLQLQGPGGSTGSEGTRGMLAYYFAVRSTSREYSDAPTCPMVVDSPNQQAQDKERLERIMRFLTAADLEEQQLVLGLERLDSVPAGAKVHELRVRYKLLEADAFPAAWGEIAPLLRQLGADPSSP